MYRSREVLLSIATIIIALILVVAPCYAESWDASAGLSNTQNPNGVWSYGYQLELGVDYYAYDAILFPITGLTSWEATGAYWSGYARKNTTTQPFSYQGWLEPAKLVLQPGPLDEFATARWTSPTDGYVQLQSKFTGQSSNANCTTTDVHVLKNGVSLFSGDIKGFIGTLANNYNDGVRNAKKQSYETIIPIATGDTIDFAVGYGGLSGDYYDDATGLDAVITKVADQGATITGKVTSTVPRPVSYTITDRGGIDSFLDQGSPNGNRGTNEWLYMQRCNPDWGYNTEAGYGTASPVWQWDLDIADGETIKSVSSAIMKITTMGYLPAGAPIRFYRLTAPFTEYGITWANRPARDESVYVSWTHSETDLQLDVAPLLARNGSLKTFGIVAEIDSGFGHYFCYSKEVVGMETRTTRLNATYSTSNAVELTPIPNATVKVDGTNTEVTTDAQGNFSLQVPSSASWTLGGTPISYSIAKTGVDAIVSESSPDTNNGAFNLAYITNSGADYASGGAWTACPVYQWDLDLGARESIQSVSSAIATIVTFGGIPDGTVFRFYRLTSPFNENTVTWNNRPARDESAYVEWAWTAWTIGQVDLSPLLARNGSLHTFGVEVSAIPPKLPGSWDGAYFSYTKDDVDWGATTTRLNAAYNAYNLDSAVLTGKVDITASADGYESMTKHVTVALGNSVNQNFALASGFPVPATKPFVYSDNVSVDADLSEWSPSEFIAMNEPYDVSETSIAKLNEDVPEASYAARWGANGNKLYVAIKVRDTHHHFTDDYAGWNMRDAAEIYIHTTGTGPVDYSGTQADAQQYVVGIKSSNPNLNEVWTDLGGNNPVPTAADFQASGKVVGEWIIYEMAITPYKQFALNGAGLVVSQLSAGQIIGLDVVVDGYDITGKCGMKAANMLTSKWRDYSMFASHILVQNGTITDARNAEDNASVGFNSVVSAAFNDFFYVENADRTSGIRVNKVNHGLVVGQSVYIYGKAKTLASGERYIAADGLTVSGNAAFVTPLAMTNKALGGGTQGQPGVLDGVGLNNIGLLIRTTGKVVDTSAQPASFKITDGSCVEVIVLGTVPAGAQYVTVTGISSCNMSGDVLLREIIATDISKVSQE